MSSKTIRVSQQTYDILSKQGSVADSFDDVIQRLLNPKPKVEGEKVQGGK